MLNIGPIFAHIRLLARHRRAYGYVNCMKTATKRRWWQWCGKHWAIKKFACTTQHTLWTMKCMHEWKNQS